MGLTASETASLARFPYCGAFDALRLYLRQLFVIESIPRIVRKPMPGMSSRTSLVEMLLEDGPGAVVATLDKKMRNLASSYELGQTTERER